MTAPERQGGLRIAVIVKGYPRLSETFIAQELHGLEARGLKLYIYSLRRPYDPTHHPIHEEIRAPVKYLPEYLWREPGRVIRGWWRARRLAGYTEARARFRADLKRDRTPNRIRRFGQACVLAAELTPNTHFLYAHFLHTPASVTRYAAGMLRLPFAVSAHAKDIWTTPEWEKREKIADAAWVTTCTRAGAEHLREIARAGPDQVRLHYHGLDFARFAAGERQENERPDTVRLASVGRLVAKKGYDDLLDALARLPASLNWQFEHIGGGALDKQMRARADELGIADRIIWRGRQPQAAVHELLARTDIFVLASKVAPDGDRDGLPNVLMEAQSMGVACVATNATAIPELIEDGATGRLVPPSDPVRLCAAIAEVAADPALRARLADAGTRTVRERFDMNTGLDAIADGLQMAPPNPGRAAA